MKEVGGKTRSFTNKVRIDWRPSHRTDHRWEIYDDDPMRRSVSSVQASGFPDHLTIDAAKMVLPARPFCFCGANGPLGSRIDGAMLVAGGAVDRGFKPEGIYLAEG